MPGILIDRLKAQMVTEAKALASGTYYNNGAAAANVSGIDTRGYDEAMFIINAGVASGTITAAIYESSTDTSSGSTAVSGADFDSLTTDTDEAIHVGIVKCKSTKRYLFLRMVKADTTQTDLISAEVILGRCDKEPQDNSEEFSV